MDSAALLIFAVGIVFQAGVTYGTARWVVATLKQHGTRLEDLERKELARSTLEQARLQRVHQPAL